MATIFRFSYRNGRLNCWISSKHFIVNFKLIGHIDQRVSVDFEHFFPAGLRCNPEALTSTEWLETLKMFFSYNQVCDSSDYSCSAYPKKYLVF